MEYTRLVNYLFLGCYKISRGNAIKKVKKLPTRVLVLKLTAVEILFHLVQLLDGISAKNTVTK